MNNPKLNFSIIGCGRIGRRHAALITKMGRLIAVCDVIPEQAKRMAEPSGCPMYTRYDDMLLHHPETDVVVICTPNGLHATHTIAALQASFHVLCEKPMAIHAEDCHKMIATANKVGKQLFIVKQNRFNPPVAVVKKLLEEDRLGKVFSIQLNCFWNRNEDYYVNSWHGTRDLDGGTLFTQFSHFIDLLYWMFGDVKHVQSQLRNYHHHNIIDFEDTGVVLLEFENGIIGTINYTVNSFAKNMEGSLTIFGEKGTIKIGGEYLNELEYQSIENYVIAGLSRGNPANDYGHYVGSMSNHEKVYENLMDVLQNGGKIAATGYEGMKTVEIIERVYRDRSSKFDVLSSEL